MPGNFKIMHCGILFIVPLISVAIIFFDVYFADITFYITAPDMFTVTSIVCNCMYHLYMASTTAHCITCIMVLITTFPKKYIIYLIQSMR